MSSSTDARPLITHVLHHLWVGGMENGLVNLINHLPESRWRHRVLCVEDFSDFRQRITRVDVEVLALHRSKIGVWGLRRRIFEDLRLHRPAIVHTRNLSGLDALPPAWLAGGARRLHSEHGWDVDNLDGLKQRPALLRRLHAPLVHRYVTVSKDLERYLVDRIGIHPTKVGQIYNGVDVQRFAPRLGERGPVVPPELRAPQLCLVGTVGRLQRVKDQATLLRAAAQLLQREPALRHRMRLVVVGGGPLQAELQALAQALGLAELCWFAGSIANVQEVLPNLDIFVLPSLMEGVSNTLLEAMACGLPVLATAVGGNVELMRPGEVGDLFAPGDVAALANHLVALLRDPDQVRVQGRRARAVAVESFSLATMLARYDALYDSLIGRSRP